MQRTKITRRGLMTIAVAILAIMALTATTASAATNRQIRHALAQNICGEASDWTVDRDGYGNYVGAKFDSQDEERCKAPKSGRLDTACGRIWSTNNVTRRISITEGTFWRFGKHRNLTNCALTKAQAAKKYRTGDGTAQHWSLKAYSENTGWIYNGPSDTLYAYHGHIDHQFGTTGTGRWTPEVPKATAWYWNS